MRQVFTSQNLTHVDLAKSLLESSGIGCLIKNEHAAHTSAGGAGFPMVFAWPEIWVGEDDFQKAQQVIDQFREDHRETEKQE